MKYTSFLRLLQYMSIKTNNRLYIEYINKAKLERIINDIENSKKGIYYLIDYNIVQKQYNIIGRSFKQ